jgi:enamine deaminase RidA (YjgF/YER057c/UK114 family)
MSRLSDSSEALVPEPQRVALSRRFVAPGEPSVRPDGTLDGGLEAQMQSAWTKLFDLMGAAGYEKRHLVKTTVLVTEGGNLHLYRAVRDRMLGAHTAASSYLHVEGPGAPSNLVEIEGVAVKE